MSELANIVAALKHMKGLKMLQSRSRQVSVSVSSRTKPRSRTIDLVLILDLDVSFASLHKSDCFEKFITPIFDDVEDVPYVKIFNKLTLHFTEMKQSIYQNVPFLSGISVVF